MDYSDTFRRASSSRRYNDRAENSYGNVGSARLTSAVNHGPSNLPGPSTVPPRREDAENGNSNHRPSPGSARPRRDKPRPVIIEEYETEVFHHRPPDRRARVEDEAEPANPHTDPGPSSGPFVADRVSADRVSHSFLRPGGLPPPPPPPPPPYISHGISEERPSHRRHTGRVPLQPPPPYLVPQGFVTPSPYLVSSYQQPPDSGSGSGHGHGRTGDGSGGGGGRHDLATLAGQPDPKASEKVRSSIVICVYRRNRLKSFDYRMVQLRSSTARRPDRGGQGYSYTQDLLLFQQMRRTYENEMRGWVRRLLSFKALSTVRLLQYGDKMVARPDQEDDTFSSDFMRIWHNPKEELDGAMDRYEWNRWLLQQKALSPDLDMAIELVEDYVPDRIVLFASIWLIGIAGLTAAWLIKGGEAGLVATVMSFVLNFTVAVVALTTVWDWFDGGRSKEMQQRAVVMMQNTHGRPLSQKPGQKGSG